MFETLQKINQRPEPFSVYTAQTLWDDDHISKQMLDFHLNPDAEPASRNHAFVERSAKWMIDHFAIGPGKRICDFGCGPGLYTTSFARAGASVTGIDFSRRSIAYATASAGEKGLDIAYIHSDYLEYRPAHAFDLITMIYCDLCALSPRQRQAVYKTFRENLAKNGRIFLDLFSLAAFKARREVTQYGHGLMNGFWSEKDYYGFLNTFIYRQQHVVLDKYTLFEKTRTWEVFNWLQYFSFEALSREFEENGLRILARYADVGGSPYDAAAEVFAVEAVGLY